ncbi:YdcF family protein [Thiorhodococcus fuscus]|uniref:YdcF family protein n=1 Tax=Thiorhodococcus fuscus TaxID=527200 RepID=A0ABW4YA68_9GAMM
MLNPRQPDWDGLFTMTLTVAVVLATFGLAYLYWLKRVIETARAVNASRTEYGGWLVVPGKRLIEDRPDADFRQRLDRAATLARPPFAGRLAILGGRTAHANLSEAQAGADYLELRGMNQDLSLILEGQSRNTLTNLRNLRELANRENDRQARFLIVSSRYHLARVGLMAASLGLRHRLEPAEPRLSHRPATLLQLARESFLCLWFMVGKGWAAITRNQRMLARVT